jgi:serine phosphatase RsbU (regulator of sigma subunit)/anti-sigma regulatory factor (Ser/Thr protein kinase)
MGVGRDLAARHKDGSEFPVEVSLSYVETRQGIVVMTFVTEITWRKEAERELKAYSERLEELVEERTRGLRAAQAQLLAQQRLQQEVELAAQVQASLLPRAVPSIDGYDFAATARPARYVSGDVYDFIATESGACHIVLADIAGKGIPAALLASTARTLVRAETDHAESPAAILTSVGRSFYDDLNHAEMFITFLVARLDPRWGRLTYASAGHVQILHWRAMDGTVDLLPATGMPIGVLPEAAIAERVEDVCPGDVLLFSSDGIVEAANAAGELFGMDRLVATLVANAGRPAADLAQAIVSAVEAFCGDVPRSDDLTLVVLQAQPRTLSFAYPAALAHLNEVTGLIRRATAPYGDDFAYQMELAASEIVTNVIEHSYRGASGEIRGQIDLTPDRVSIDVYDDGRPFDPQATSAPPRGALREGGYGLLIAEELTDELSYEPASSSGNHWRLMKRIVEGVSDDVSDH